MKGCVRKTKDLISLCDVTGLEKAFVPSKG